MNKKNTHTLVLLYFFLLSFNIWGQKENPFEFAASYTGDNVYNTIGGIKTGHSYLGMANLIINFNTEKAGLWKGGEINISGGNTHGGEPTTNYIGDFQTASNIEAGNLTYLQELHIKQTFGKFNLTIGLQDLNAEYLVSEYAGVYLNSSFGIHPTVSGNIPAPIFPLTALGISLGVELSDNIYFQTVLFDGAPTDFDNNNPHNLNYGFHKKEGWLSVSEIQYKKGLIKGLFANYKLGFYYHSQTPDLNNNEKQTNNYGVYAVIDQMILKKSNQDEGLGVFLQIGLSPKKKNIQNSYYGIGANYRGLITQNDELGLSLAQLNFSTTTLKTETAIELTYQASLYDNIFIQPDIQYIIHPSGTENKLENALVGTLRLGFEF